MFVAEDCRCIPYRTDLLGSVKRGGFLDRLSNLWFLGMKVLYGVGIFLRRISAAFALLLKSVTAVEPKLLLCSLRVLQL